MTAKKAGGGKLTRSETVTVRLDPRLRYLAELAARKQRRTLSSYIEWSIEESLQHVALANEGDSLAVLARDLWDVDEADRFAKLAFRFPDLLTHEEQVLWKLICEYGALWHYHSPHDDEYVWAINEDNLIVERLRENWELFKAIAAGEEGKAKLPRPEIGGEPAFDPSGKLI